MPASSVRPAAAALCSQCGQAPARALGLCPACFVTTADEATTVSGSGTTQEKTWLETPDRTGFWELRPGAPLDDGRYTLEHKLGEGGMGDVWLATDHHLQNRQVAVKFLSQRLLESAPARERLKQEVLLTRELRRETIVAVYDWGEPSGEPPFFTMEFVPGANLAQLLRLPGRGQFTWPELEPHVGDLLDALIYAHGEKQLVHRDLKPANLLLGLNGRLKVADFGIAQRHVEEAAGQAASRRAGTWAYASPQQFTGAQPALPDDLYAVGATLYELLTGELPFDPRAADFEARLRYETVEPITKRLRRLGRPRLPSKYAYVASAVAACLAKDPEQRPTAPELRRWLAGLGAPERLVPEQAERVSWLGETFKWLCVCLMAAIATGSIDYSIRGQKSWVYRTLITRIGTGSTTNPTPEGAPADPSLARLTLSLANPPDADLRVIFRRAGDDSIIHTLSAGTKFLELQLRPGRYQVEVEPRVSPEGAVFQGAEVELVRSRKNELLLRWRKRPPGTSALLLRRVNAPAGPLALELVLPDGSTNFQGSFSDASQLIEDVPAVPQAELRIGPPTRELEVRRRSWLVRPVKLTPPLTDVPLDFTPVRIGLREEARLPVSVVRSNLWGPVRLEPLPQIGMRGANAYDGHPAVPTTFIFKHPGYHDLATNLFPLPGQTLNLEFRLVPWTTPEPGKRWVSSLGMGFQAFGRFWVAEKEVTVAQYAEFARATGRPRETLLSITAAGRTNQGRTWENPWANMGPVERLDDHPVVGVSWSDATAFCEWLTLRDRQANPANHLAANQHYTLPNAGHWRALAGNHAYPWGDHFPPEPKLGNFAGMEVRHASATDPLNAWAASWFEHWPFIPGRDDGHPRTAPTGAFQRTGSQGTLYDVAGNAAEWGMESHPDNPNARVVRGGSWFDDQPDDLRTDAVRWFPADTRDDRIGFRLILVETDSASATPP